VKHHLFAAMAGHWLTGPDRVARAPEEPTHSAPEVLR